MSIQLIQQYYSKVEQVIRYGGSRNEQSLRKPFQDLLEQYARSKNLALVAEVEHTTKTGRRVIPDGTLKDALRQDWGFWESKDEKDVLADEIAAKLAKGYPTFNILFEDTQTAVLFQGGEEVLRVPFLDAVGLDRLLTLFVSYEPREVTEFHKAIQLFSAEIGGLAEALRAVISDQLSVNSEFARALGEFLELCKKSINPKIEMADVREMIIQHVLTEDIFMRVFDEAEFHRENVIAHKLAEVAGAFYHGDTKRNIHARIAPYYETINAKASQISDHHEKQKFLKALYESFYKAYNPKAADRLGIVYTPDEIVRFMIESADHLTWQHFGKGLGERGVEILDPATGTGTFISELIEYLPPAQLEYKYEHEIHCNEVSILPYYIANLNIEYTFKQKTGRYKEFANICFVDTLDNMGFEHTGQQMNFFGLTDANAERITRQNSRPIMLVIGNPPYNANQANENENNKNREYPEVDARIKETYIKHSTAQKTKVYDMYARFYRWASDRLDKNGIIAFITNSSFLDSRTFDGFRKVVASEFSHIYIVDLGGNVRKNPKLSGTTNNVFGIQTGVCIAFMVKTVKKGKTQAQIFYTHRPELELATDKLEFLRAEKFSAIKFEHLQPDAKNNWLNITHNDWESLLPLASKTGKSEKGSIEPKTIFKSFSLGVATNRDEWVYDDNADNLEQKIKFFFDTFETEKKRWVQSNKKMAVNDFVDRSIKWTSELESHLLRDTKLEFSKQKITVAMYRPFVKKKFYYDQVIVHRPYQQPNFFKIGQKPDNQVLCVNMNGAQFNVLSVNAVPDLHFNGDSQCFPFYRYTTPDRSSGESVGQGSAADNSTGSVHRLSGLERIENITDWALGQFRKQYGPHPLAPSPKTKSGEGGQRRDGAAPLLRPEEKGSGDEVRGKRSAPYELWEKLKPLARQMRHEPTQAEDRLWQSLRNRQVKNAKFRRQHAIDRFIVDFYCPEFNLVIEADGEIHQYTVEEDARRQEYLESQGLRVLRFSNDEVLKETEKVITKISEALTPFVRTLEKKTGGEIPYERDITKLDIFHYVYAVLHHPAYRAKYEQNLKREFPRIPFYEDFWQWAGWGERLMELHLGYESVDPWPLERINASRRGTAEDATVQVLEPSRRVPTVRLIARKDTGVIEIDSDTSLRRVPAEAWEYRLGTYSALEWVLERYKEKKPKDPTIAEKFNTYRFADYKESVITLLGKVCRVSVETMKIVREMP